MRMVEVPTHENYAATVPAGYNNLLVTLPGVGSKILLWLDPNIYPYNKLAFLAGPAALSDVNTPLLSTTSSPQVYSWTRETLDHY